jgi:diguanylate cyclase (GGDEF)-like protein/PAS domain S-box-containing protein
LADGRATVEFPTRGPVFATAEAASPPAATIAGEPSSPWLHSEAAFRSLVELATELILVWGADGSIIYASPATIRFAYGEGAPDGGEDIVSTAGDVHPDDVERVQRIVADLLPRFGDTARFVARYRRHDGEYRSLAVTVTNRLHDPSLRGMVGHSRDITEQVVSDEALRRSEQHVRALLRRSSDVVAVVDREGRLLRPSPNQVLGYPEGSLVGRSALELVHAEDLPAVVAALARVADDATAIAQSESRLRRADGTWRWFELVFANCLDDPAVAGIVVNGHDVTDRKRYEDELVRAALHDTLTGLPNRALVEDRIDRALQTGRRVGALFLDVDRFKVLNDARGHHAGDALLVELAARLTSLVRPGDTVARFGGDEFLVVCEDTSAIELRAIAQRLVESFTEPFEVDGEHVVVTVTIGVALAEPGGRGDSLIRDADAAMYHAKRKGRNCVEFFDRALRTRVLARLNVEGELRRALDNDEFVVWYQPIVDLATGATCGAEALLRWDHPTRGLVLPGEFIGVAEETGLIVPIGASVLERAARDARACQVVVGRPFRVAVNLSPRQLQRPRMALDVAAALAAAHLPADSLVVELTETALVDSSRQPTATLHALHDLGVRLGLDDFGTGYSSLSYLKQFPIQLIKIDRGFIQELDGDGNDDTLVAATLAIASTLRLDVVAEGVETDRQRQTLLQLGCSRAQGFLFAPAMPVAALLDQLDRTARQDA